ncbi:MAG TPA: metallophosphatase family protein, partial [Rhodospirillales bacterium]|nr:metallophosphatase family protein [Rhodospirillales bacterium]
MNDLGEIDAPVLLFGGPYSNWQATKAILAKAGQLAIPPERIICTGDTVAYCGDPARTVAAIRRSGIHVIMGNCEESLGHNREDCGCGFVEGSDCETLSVLWFSHSLEALDDDDKAWMSGLPGKLTFSMNGRKLAVIHGGVENISHFVYRSDPADEKTHDLDTLGVDGII